MNDDLDRTLRAALIVPNGDSLPIGLMGDIHGRLLATPQRGPGLVGRLPRWVPPMGPDTMRLLAVVAVTLAVLVGTLVYIGLSRPDQPLIQSYHGGGAQTGVLLGPAPVGVPAVLHRVELGGQMDALSTPVAGDGVAIFVSRNGIATAVDLVTGAERWRVEGLGENTGSPALVGDVLVIASLSGTTVGLDVENGSERWRGSIDALVTSPLNADDDTVLIGTASGLHAIDARDGQSRWTADTVGAILRSPAIADGVAYVAAEGGQAIAIDMATGHEHWRTDVGPGEISTPAVSDGVMYFIVGPKNETGPHAVVALDAATGTEIDRWTSPVNERMFTAAVVDGVVFTTAEDGIVRRIETARDADMQTFFETGRQMGTLATVVVDDLFISTAEGAVWSIDRTTGAQRWRVVVPADPTMPVVVDGRILVGTATEGLILGR